MDALTAYRHAIDLTTRTVERRAALFRNQVVTVVVAGLLALVFAVSLRATWPLLGILYWIPSGALFVYLDNRALEDWRRELFVRWVDRTIDFVALRAAIQATPTLPRQTVDAMLATIPNAADLPAESALTESARLEVSLTARLAQKRRLQLLLTQAIASAVAVSSLAAALWAHRSGWRSPLAMLPGTVSVVVLAVSAWRTRTGPYAREVFGGF